MQAAVRHVDFVACDLDGTLLTSQHVLSERTRRTLLALVCSRAAHTSTPAPLTLILATGRQYTDVRVIAERLQAYLRAHITATATLPALYLLTSNGAVVHDTRTGACVAGHYLAEDVVRELYAFVPSCDTHINVSFYQHEHWYTRYDWPSMLVHHSESGVRYNVLAELPPPSTTMTTTAAAYTADDVHGGASDKRDDGSSNKDENNNSSSSAEATTSAAHGDLRGISVVFYSSSDAQALMALEQQLRQRFGDTVAITMSAPFCLDVVAKGVNKAAGLRDVFAALPLQPWEEEQQKQEHMRHHDDDDERSLAADRLRRTVAFGDGMNDAEMLQAVGRGYIMGNANPRLKAALPHLEVIGSNDDDAVARKLQELFDLPEQQQQ